MNMIRRSDNRHLSVNFLCNSRGKKIWSTEEDVLLRTLVESIGTGNWTLVAQSLPERTGKQCRERWHNHLGAGIKKGDWTEEEDRIIISMQKSIGNQWAKITKMLPGRTDNAVKNRFHATERAKSRNKFDDGPDKTSLPHAEATVNASSSFPHHVPQACADYYPHQIPPVRYDSYYPHSHQEHFSSSGHLPHQSQGAAASYVSAIEDDDMSDLSDHGPDQHSSAAVGYHGPAHTQQYMQQQQHAMVMPVQCKVEEDSGCESGDSVTDLMELDIISFGEDDLACYDDGVVAAITYDPYGQQQHARQHHQQYPQHQQQHRQEVDPRCFNSDWTSTLCGGGSRQQHDRRNHMQHDHVHDVIGSGQINRNVHQFSHQQSSNMRLGCGLETWGRSSSEHHHNIAGSNHHLPDANMHHQQLNHQNLQHPHVPSGARRGGWLSGAPGYRSSHY